LQVNAKESYATLLKTDTVSTGRQYSDLKSADRSHDYLNGACPTNQNTMDVRYWLFNWKDIFIIQLELSYLKCR